MGACCSTESTVTQVTPPSPMPRSSTAKPAFGDQCAVLVLPAGKTVIIGKRVQRHEPGIMPVGGVFLSRIAKTCEQQHVTLGGSDGAAGRSAPD